MNPKFKTALAPEGAIIIACLCALSLLASPTLAQNSVSYGFTGSVRSLNQGSSIFAGVNIGTPVQGQFTIDYGASDTQPEPGLGIYQSLHVAFNGSIGGHVFASTAAPFNQINVDDGTDLMPADFVILAVQPGSPADLSGLQLTFYDPTGQAINSDALPNSAAAFDAFPDLVLYAQSSSGFGQYVLDVSITPVPEPSSVMLFAIVAVAFAGVRWRHLRSRLNDHAADHALQRTRPSRP